MASSISRPTHRLSAISVIMLIVKPNMSMNRKVPMMAIGSVRPVITVERQEFRNRNTISTVRIAPSISVWRTLATETRIWREPSAIGSSRRPGGSCLLHLGDGRLQAVDHGDGVFVLRLLHRQQQRALAVVQRQAVDLLRAVDDAGQLVQPHRRAVAPRDDDLAEVLAAARCAPRSAPPVPAPASGSRPPAGPGSRCAPRPRPGRASGRRPPGRAGSGTG